MIKVGTKVKVTPRGRGLLGVVTKIEDRPTSALAEKKYWVRLDSGEEGWYFPEEVKRA